jgi:hypothetical protein
MRWIAFLAVLLAPVAAAADTLTVGVFAPATPFESAAARVEIANELADVLGKAAGADGVGKVYARAGDFAAAVKKGEVQVALVDATYLANAGGGTVIAVSVRGGATSHAWQVVARGGAKSVLALEGKKLVVPALGGRESDFVLNAMFGGELAKGFFASIASSPDTASTLAALSAGKAEVAVVPGDAALPSGVAKVASLPAVPGPVLVAYGTTSSERRSALASAAAGFSAGSVIGSFEAGDGDAVKSLGKRFSAQTRKGPMAVPSVRIVVGDLVANRVLSIAPTDAVKLAAPIEPPKE